jgi:hypothetical protein
VVLLRYIWNRNERLASSGDAPYGKEILQEQRLDAIPEIKDELTRFAQERFQYKFSDLRSQSLLNYLFQQAARPSRHQGWKATSVDLDSPFDESIGPTLNESDIRVCVEKIKSIFCSPALEASVRPRRLLRRLAKREKPQHD